MVIRVRQPVEKPIAISTHNLSLVAAVVVMVAAAAATVAIRRSPMVKVKAMDSHSKDMDNRLKATEDRSTADPQDLSRAGDSHHRVNGAAAPLLPVHPAATPVQVTAKVLLLPKEATHHTDSRDTVVVVVMEDTR